MEETIADAELLRRYAEEKSEAAFADLVQRHLNLVYSAALRQVGGDAHHAQDVTQTVFTVLARKAASVARHPVLVGWLYTSTQHAAAKLRRAEARRHAREHEAHLMHELTAPSAPVVEWDQLRPVLDDAMRELGDRDREAVLLRFFAQRPFAEIGAALGLSEDAARMRVERALDKLHALLARRGLTSTSAALAVALANQAVAAAPAGLVASVTGSALASAVGAPAVSFLNFMSTTKFAAGAAGIVLALSIGTAVREVRGSRMAEAALDAANKSYAAAADRLRAIEQHANDAQAAQSSLQSEAAAAAPVAASSPAASGAGRPAPPPRDATKARAATRELETAHPEVHRALLEAGKANLAARYRGLFEALKLTPGQAEQFETIMLDATPVAEAGGLRRSSPLGTYDYSFATTDDPISATERDARLLQLLGPDGMQQLQEFKRTGLARSFANMVAQSAFDAGEAFTPGQSRQLVQIVTASIAANPAGKDASLADIGNAVQQQAQAVFSERQVGVIAASIQQVEFNRAWAAAVKVAADNANAGAAAAH